MFTETAVLIIFQNLFIKSLFYYWDDVKLQFSHYLFKCWSFSEGLDICLPILLLHSPFIHNIMSLIITSLNQFCNIYFAFSLPYRRCQCMIKLVSSLRILQYIVYNIIDSLFHWYLRLRGEIHINVGREQNIFFLLSLKFVPRSDVLNVSWMIFLNLDIT